MLVDTRQLDEAARIERDVCVIGGGAAGVTIALELARHGVGVAVLESGGLEPDEATLDLYRGENAGLPYSFADECRSRFLGGSSNCWGGWCRPLDEWDFAHRDWVPNSGWPFGASELAAHYERAHRVLKLGPPSFDPAFWEAAIGREDVRRFPFASPRIVDTISQFSPPVRFGIDYRDELKRSRTTDVYLYANAVDIETDGDARTVKRVLVRTLSGRSVWAHARLFVLATGGIENARLLLASDKAQPGGLGNGNDLVGRYFMDHPRIMCGSVRFAERWARNKLYDFKFHYLNPAVSAHGTCIASQFALTPEVQRQEKLLNSRVWFASVFPGEGTESVQALIRCKLRLTKKDEMGHRLSRDLLAILANPYDAARFAVARALHPRSLIKDVRLHAIVEPEPDPQSRVTLCEARDALGMRRTRVTWRLGSAVKRTFDRTFEILSEELRRHGIAEVELDPPLADRDWPGHMEGTWHHMGTTRMHDSPRRGVVDRDCRIHGMTNLYVAGSSVFPTAGANFPTITLVALACRLSDRLAHELQRPAAIAAGGTAALAARRA
ncbi:MAG: GMC family oxidoreductase [Burkholderiales bacterium]|nr:GMC family oxidoreductase [Burkholderiales bacterium]